MRSGGGDANEANKTIFSQGEQSLREFSFTGRKLCNALVRPGGCELGEGKSHPLCQDPSYRAAEGLQRIPKLIGHVIVGNALGIPIREEDCTRIAGCGAGKAGSTSLSAKAVAALVDLRGCRGYPRGKALIDSTRARLDPPLGHDYCLACRRRAFLGVR